MITWNLWLRCIIIIKPKPSFQIFCPGKTSDSFSYHQSIPVATVVIKYRIAWRMRDRSKSAAAVDGHRMFYDQTLHVQLERVFSRIT